jgi:exosortase/archaeosortase family protein
MILQDIRIKKIVTLIIKTLSIYTILSVFFYCYEGLVDPKGSYYSAFLDKYSIIQLILNCLINPIVWVLEIIGYEVLKTADTVGIMYQKRIHILAPCLGIKIMIAYTSLILGFPGNNKILFLILGIAIIHVMNIGRMLAIILMNQHYPDIVNISHDFFNYTSYALIIGLYYYWIKKYNVGRI